MVLKPRTKITVRDLKKEEQFLKVFRMQVLGLTD